MWTRFKYGNFQPFQPLQQVQEQTEQWHFEVVFDYGEYNLDANDSTLDTPVRSWTNRQDSFSTYQAGFEIRTHRLCRSILMFHRFEAEFGRSEPVLVNATRFSYDETPIVTQLTGVDYVGYSYENGQYKTKKIPPLEFKPTSSSPTNEIYLKSLGQRNGMRKKNEYELDGLRIMRSLTKEMTFNAYLTRH